jgi:hypothetical protein
MVGQMFVGLWVRVLLAVVPATLVAAVLSRGRPARGRELPPRVQIIGGLVGVVGLVIVLIMPYPGARDPHLLRAVAAWGIPPALTMIALGWIRLRRQ